MSSPYYWSGLFVLLIMFGAVLNALLDIRNELRRLNGHLRTHDFIERMGQILGKERP